MLVRVITPRRVVWRIGIAAAALAVSIVAASGQPRRTLAELLAEAQTFLREGKIQPALDLLEKAMEAGAELETAHLTLQEDLRWQVAMASLDYAQELSNEKQYKAYASRARELWKEYIDWYHGLPAAQRMQLSPNHNRIHRATAFLGNASVRMDRLEQVLTDYADIQDVGYLGSNAMELWKSTLYRCPDWARVAEQTAAARRTKVCTERCQDHWIAYAGTLAEWAPKFSLREGVRQRYLREADQIRNIAAQCPPAAAGVLP